VDCIKLGILELLDELPDLVISGINPGANTGVNINYSGTVAAAKEASLYGIPSISASIQGHDPLYLDDAASFLFKLAKKISKTGLPSGTFLNINLPDIPTIHSTTVRISHQDLNFYNEFIQKKTDPRNRTYYWHGIEMENNFPDSLADTPLLNRDCISITPIKCDMTDYDVMGELKFIETDYRLED
jgi:5'-nucleotidase